MNEIRKDKKRLKKLHYVNGYDGKILFPFFISSAEITGDDLWFIDNVNSGLYCFDLVRGIVKSCYRIPDTTFFGENKYSGLIINNDKIILLPGYERSIVFFDIEREKFSKININEPIGQKIPLYSSHHIYNNFIYMFMNAVGKILVIDLEKEKVGKIIPIPISLNEKFFLNISKNCAYLKSFSSNIIVKFDFKNQSFEKQKVIIDNDQYQILEGEGSDVFFRGDYGKVYKWNGESEIPEFMVQYPADLKYFFVQNKKIEWKSYRNNRMEYYSCDNLYDDGTGIWILPHFSCELVYINKYSKKIRTMMLKDEDESAIRDKLLWGKYYRCLCKNDNFLWIYSIKRSLFYKINVKEFSYEEVCIYISERFWYDWMNECFTGKPIVVENGNINVVQLIEYVKVSD